MEKYIRVINPIVAVAVAVAASAVLLPLPFSLFDIVVCRSRLKREQYISKHFVDTFSIHSISK